MATLIPLTQGKFTTVDDDDVCWVRQHQWRYYPRPTGAGYAGRPIQIGGKQSTVYLHRVIVGAPREMEVDHRDGDGLNNQRRNLRLATRSQNNQNRRGVRPESRTGVRGVTVTRYPHRPYHAYLYIDGRKRGLGYFATIEEADSAAREGRRRLMTHAPECDEEV